MARRSQAAVARSAEAAFADALEAVVGESVRATRRGRAELIVSLDDGRAVAIEVKGVSGRAEPGPIASALKTWNEQLRRTSDDDGPAAYGVLVAAAIPDATKSILRENGWGWFDRRGELDLRVPGLVVHTANIAPAPDEVRAEPKQAIRGRAGVTVAAALMLDPEVKRGVREIARAGDIAPSIASTSLADLRRASLVRADGLPLLPDLFWALADAWKSSHEALELAPTPKLGRRLDLGLDDMGDIGWVVGGSLAAAAWSAPVVVGSAAAPDFYVPSEPDLRAARRELHAVPMSETRGCTVAVTPTILAVRPRHDPSSLATPSLEWPVVHPLFAALDLAQDRARGVEILEDWTPPPPFVRVW